MKAVICLMFACVLMASTAHGAGAGAGGTRWAENSVQRRAPPVVRHAEDEPHRIGAEVRRSHLLLHAVAGHPRLRRAARARRQLAVQRLRGRQGEANPHQGSNLEKTKTTRADIIQALADSFAFCDPAFANLTDQSALELVRQGQNEVARGSVLANLIVHGNEEYGILTVYMRTKGMVPPSTERGMRGRGAGRHRQSSCGRCNEKRKTKNE